MRDALYFFFLLNFAVAAQSFASKSDSLLKLSGRVHDTVKCRIYNELAVIFRNANPDTSLYFARNAGELALKSGARFEYAQALNNEGICYYLLGENKNALQKYIAADSAAIAAGSRFLLAKIYNNTGAVYFNIGDYKRAYEKYLKALELRRASGDSIGMAASFNNLGNSCLKFGSTAMALDYYQQSMNIKNRTGDLDGALLTMMNMGTVYFDSRQENQALEYYSRALELSRKQGSQMYISAALMNIGGVYSYRKEFRKSIEYHLQALSIKKKIDDAVGSSMCLINIGENYLELKEYVQALKYLTGGLSLSVNAGAAENEMNAHQWLALVNEHTGNFSEAYKNQKRYTILRDSLSNVAQANQIGALQERNEIEKVMLENQQREKERQRINAEITERRNNIQYLAIFLFVLLLFTAAFFTGRLKMSEAKADGLMFFGFIILYEFISLLLDPVSDKFSANVPALKLSFNAMVALLMVPFQYLLENRIKKIVLQNRST